MTTTIQLLKPRTVRFALVTAILGETISAVAWSLEGDGKWQGKLLRPLIDGLFYFVQKDHCAQAWQWQKHLYVKE